MPESPTGLPDLAEIHDVRSVWGEPLEIPIGECVTVLVGPNRAGATGVLFALAASLDPAITFVSERDRPFGLTHLTANPQVRWRLDNQSETAGWDRDGGHHSQPPGAGVAASVVYAPVEATTATLLDNARVAIDHVSGVGTGRSNVAEAILTVAQQIVPEISHVEIIDGDQPPADGGARVVLHDDHGAVLPEPQARALVALGIAQHLSAVPGTCRLVAMEAPEAFLHPAAQERLARVLTDVAERTGVRVVIATTSPFVIPRHASTSVVAIARDGQGCTRSVGTALGHQPQAALLGGLLRDEGFAGVLDRASRVAEGTRAVLVVEGGTDEVYLRSIAAKVGRAGVLDDVHIWPAGGAMGVALTAIVLRAEVATPVLVLLDHDEAGRRARDTLVSRFGFVRSLHVVTYADVFDGVPQGVEAETLFDLEFMRTFVAQHPRSVTRGERREHGVTTVTLTASGKSAFVGWMRDHFDAEQAGAWPAFIDLLGARVAVLIEAGSTPSS